MIINTLASGKFKKIFTTITAIELTSNFQIKKHPSR
ncbi:hypothetical protein ZPR_1677 [Zunongwangia profunda SM-A87]|uniref:Uncharacterized protein n=1 Tax=Zunongwangia profunda (strain DSM 18752 / CCTCC AB 206139 / SM-A87) TaxID=655815 RepID=D5BLP5_ZUNPS|nr:hypothetical protein ZPR_1677 [Zunongwangia profunda SM-A87]